MLFSCITSLRSAAVAVLLWPVLAGASQDIIYHNMPGNVESNLPFSSAVQVGNLLYLSGAWHQGRNSSHYGHHQGNRRAIWFFYG